MSDFSTPTYPESFDFPRGSSYTPAPGKDKERASINWGIWNGNARCTVWTRVDDDKMVNGKKQGPIQCGIGLEAIDEIMEGAVEFWKSGATDVIIHDNYISPKNPDGSPSYERVVGSSFVVGRGEDGVCYYGLRSADESRPVIMFRFEGFEWHKARRKSGSFTADELSTAQAVSVFRYLQKALFNCAKGVTPEERKAAAARRKEIREGRGSAPAPKPKVTEASGFSDDFEF